MKPFNITSSHMRVCSPPPAAPLPLESRDFLVERSLARAIDFNALVLTMTITMSLHCHRFGNREIVNCGDRISDLVGQT